MTGARASIALASVASGTLWLARCLLVLLLVCDQLGSPLHVHRHDSGVDALWSHSRGERHVEDGDVGLSLSHAVMAVRSQAERQFGAAADLDRSLHVVTAGLAAMPVSPRAVRLPPGISRTVLAHGYRSLPPEGRAPPLRA